MAWLHQLTSKPDKSRGTTKAHLKKIGEKAGPLASRYGQTLNTAPQPKLQVPVPPFVVVL